MLNARWRGGGPLVACFGPRAVLGALFAFCAPSSSLIVLLSARTRAVAVGFLLCGSGGYPERLPLAATKMHSTWIRLNAVVFFSISLLGIAALLASWSTYFHRSHPVVTKFEFNQLRELKPTMSKQPGTRDIDRADITFDLECDLSSVFDWCVGACDAHLRGVPARSWEEDCEAFCCVPARSFRR